MIKASASGSYTVSVTDANGCVHSLHDALPIYPLPVVSITPSGSTTFCAGGSVDLTANPAGASYLWSNGAVTRTIKATAKVSYTVSVACGNGCVNTASQGVTVNPVPVVSITPHG